MKKRPFKLPEAFLNQLGEFTNGYFLIVLNHEGQFEVYDKADTQADQLAIINFLDVQGAVLQEVIRSKMLEEALGKEDEDEGDEELSDGA